MSIYRGLSLRYLFLNYCKFVFSYLVPFPRCDNRIGSVVWAPFTQKAPTYHPCSTFDIEWQAVGRVNAVVTFKWPTINSAIYLIEMQWWSVFWICPTCGFCDFGLKLSKFGLVILGNGLVKNKSLRISWMMTTLL